MDSKKTLPAGITTFGDAVRYLRDQRGLTLRALARAIDVSAPFLSDIEHNRRNTDKLDALADALRCSVDELKALDGRLTPDTKKWLEENPGFAKFLEEVRESGRSPEELRMLLHARPPSKSRAKAKAR